MRKKLYNKLMLKCKNCGNEYEGNFCPVCGTRAEEKKFCPACGAALDRDAEFCACCGSPVADKEDARKKNAIKNETHVDAEYNLRASDNIAGKKSRIVMIAAGAFLILFGVAFYLLDYFVLSGADCDIFFPLFCGVLGAVFLVFGIVFKSVLRKTVQKNMQGKESTEYFTFYEDGYEIVTRLNDGTESKSTGGYNGFTEAREYKDMFLLYINKATVFSVDKTGMKQGTAEELAALLLRKTGDRYKVKYKK